jgi:DNA-binding response OmpR family regulator
MSFELSDARYMAARPSVQIVSSGGAELIADLLAKRGWRVEPIQSFRTGASPHGDVVVLHPDQVDRERAIALCARLAKADGPAVLFLLPGEGAIPSIEALEAGADDCLAAPHNTREVVARVQALHRRLARIAAPRHLNLGWSGARFDAANRTVTTTTGSRVALTERQTNLLTALLKRPGAWVDREALLDEVMGPDGETFERAIDVHVCRLKRKLDEADLGHLITSARGGGYRLNLIQA